MLQAVPPLILLGPNCSCRVQAAPVSQAIPLPPADGPSDEKEAEIKNQAGDAQADEHDGDSSGSVQQTSDEKVPESSRPYHEVTNGSLAKSQPEQEPAQDVGKRGDWEAMVTPREVQDGWLGIPDIFRLFFLPCLCIA